MYIISIDQNEFAQLKLLCDDIFGDNNFIGTLIWRKKYGGGQTDEFFVTENEYIFGYRKTDKFKWYDKKLEASIDDFKYEDEKDIFQNPKPIELIQYIMEHVKSDLVLDFFAGSGIIGHVILEQNKLDKKNRKFILCTNNENEICTKITYRRLKIINDDNSNITAIPLNLKYYQTSYIPRINTEENNLHNNLMKNIINLI